MKRKWSFPGKSMIICLTCKRSYIIHPFTTEIRVFKISKLKMLNSAYAFYKCICMAESQKVPGRQQDVGPAL